MAANQQGKYYIKATINDQNNQSCTRIIEVSTRYQRSSKTHQLEVSLPKKQNMILIEDPINKAQI